MAKTALVISAHSADFVWRCGGAIALHQEKGYEARIFLCLVHLSSPSRGPRTSEDVSFNGCASPDDDPERLVRQ